MPGADGQAVWPLTDVALGFGFAAQRVGGQRPFSGTSIETAYMQFGDSNGVMPFDR